MRMGLVRRLMRRAWFRLGRLSRMLMVLRLMLLRYVFGRVVVVVIVMMRPRFRLMVVRLVMRLIRLRRLGSRVSRLRRSVVVLVRVRLSRRRWLLVVVGFRPIV